MRAEPIPRRRLLEVLSRFDHGLLDGSRMSLEPIETLPADAPASGDLQTPVTLTFDVGLSEVRSMLKGRGTRLALLRVDVDPVANAEDFFVHVFWDKADARVQTPFEDPRFAGGFAFFCHERATDDPFSCPAPSGPLRYELDVTRPNLLVDPGPRGDEDATVTLVPIPYEGRPRTGDGRLSVSSAELAVVQSIVHTKL